MQHRSPIPYVFTWLFLISALILTGGGLFQELVMTPLWAGSPPESVTSWPYGSVQGKFFMVASPIYYLFSLALVVSAWWMPRRHRPWALAAGACGLVVGVATFTFYLPIIRQLHMTRGAGLTGEEITLLVDKFKSTNWWRWGLLIGSWVAALRVLTTSGERHAARSLEEPQRLPAAERQTA